MQNNSRDIPEGGWIAFQCEPQMDADTRRLKVAAHCFTAKGAKIAKRMLP